MKSYRGSKVHSRKQNQITHRLINQERKKKGLPPVKWSPKMYRLAKDQSTKMAKAGRLFHSNRPALQGGENICGGKGCFSPKDFVRSWMKSPRHRAWLLDPGVKTAAVSISISKRGTFTAWSFSDQPLLRLVPIKQGITGWLYKLFHTTYSTLAYRSKAITRPLPVKPVTLNWSAKASKWLVQLVATCLAILGIHGLWVYFSRFEAVFIKDTAKLFLAIQVPAQLQNTIEWMSTKGIESWFIPAITIATGIILWRLLMPTIQREI